MSNDRNGNSGHKHSEAGLRVEHLWECADNPLLVAVVRVEHAITKACEEVDVVITRDGVTIRHQAFNALLSSHKETVMRSARDPDDLAFQLRSLGIFDLGSARQPMYDGAVAEIGARDQDRQNEFWERSTDTPQADLREVLLALAHETELEAGRDGAGQAPARSESEMTFVVTKPESKSEVRPE